MSGCSSVPAGGTRALVPTLLRHLHPSLMQVDFRRIHVRSLGTAGTDGLGRHMSATARGGDDGGRGGLLSTETDVRVVQAAGAMAAAVAASNYLVRQTWTLQDTLERAFFFCVQVLQKPPRHTRTCAFMRVLGACMHVCMRKHLVLMHGHYTGIISDQRLVHSWNLKLPGECQVDSMILYTFVSMHLCMYA